MRALESVTLLGVGSARLTNTYFTYRISWYKAFVRNIYHLLLVALGIGSILMLSGNTEANGLAVVIDVKNTPVSVRP